MKRINIGLIGFGTIGSGVVKTIREKAEFFRQNVGIDICLKYICDKDITTSRGIDIEEGLLTTNVEDILSNPQIDIVVELIGGIHPAKEYILQAIRSGKDVVTANKALLAEEGEEIFLLARRSARKIGFEASVGGGIPLIKALKEGLVSNRLSLILGIINGTSNYILSQMSEKGYELNTALEEARKEGYAERDPSLDIEGIDSAHKLAILILLGFGKRVSLGQIYTEGILGVSSADIRYTQELGYTIKLLAIARRVGKEIEARVHPTLLPEAHLLASVGSNYNAIYVVGDMVGSLLFYGQGAGQMPTASAVISDIISLARSRGERGGALPIERAGKGGSLTVRRMEDIETRYYLRFSTVDRPGVLGQIAGILGRHNISIASVKQKEERTSDVVPIVIMTHRAKEGALGLALREIDSLAVVRSKSVSIRIEEG